MSGHTDKTWRLIAYIRELASLGYTGAQIARMLGVSYSLVGALGSKHSISFMTFRSESPIRRAIRAGYAAGRSPAEIAYDTGASVSVVKALACKMGLTRGATRDPSKHRRGYVLPPERMDEYKALRKLGLTFKECGYEMGLLQRPHAHLLTVSPEMAVSP